jgi:hypothetical protein
VLVAAVAISTILFAACDDDSDDTNIDPIPTDGSVVDSGVPSTDGSTITTPAPNPDAGGGAGTTLTP